MTKKHIFFQNGKKLVNFKMCDLIFFMQSYKYAELLEEREGYAKILLSDDSIDDVWEVYETEEVNG